MIGNEERQAAGGGLPFLVGNAFGGPVAGSVSAAGAMTAGAMGRVAATAMQTKNANVASALMRGEVLSPTQSASQLNPLIGGLLAARDPKGPAR